MAQTARMEPRPTLLTESRVLRVGKLGSTRRGRRFSLVSRLHPSRLMGLEEDEEEPVEHRAKS